MTEQLARRLATIFDGLPRAYGWYAIPEGTVPDEHGKFYGRRATVKKPVTIELWQRHVAGKNGFGIGIVPIRDDATCVFGAIDIDVYPVDLNVVAANIRRLGLPVILCRTKSGGAHVYLFMKEPTPAATVRAALMEWAVLLGYPGVEVFPKQTALAGPDDDAEDSKGSGSWINIPYNGGRRSTRYALKADGEAMTPDEFVAAVDATAITIASLAAFRPTLPASTGDWFADGPPCLQTLAMTGFGDWQNNGLYNIAVYLKKRYGKDGPGKFLGAYNEQFMDPPALSAEVGGIVKSTTKKSYSYKCKDQPICAVCNKSVCLNREFGVGGRGDDPGVIIGDLVKYQTDPPTWILSVNGARVELTTKQLLNQALFREAVMDKINVLAKYTKNDAWEMMIMDKLAAVQKVEVPVDATPDGQLLVHLHRFCTSKVVGKHLDDLLRGLPFTDEKKHRTFFCSSDFLQYLQQHRVAGVDEKDLYKLLKPRDLEAHEHRIKGKPMTYWSIPAFQSQTEEHDVPRGPAPEKM